MARESQGKEKDISSFFFNVDQGNLWFAFNNQLSGFIF